MEIAKAERPLLCHLCQRCSVNMPLLVTTCLLQLPLCPRSQVSLPSHLTFHQPPHTLSTHTPSPCGILTRQNPNPNFMQTPVHSMVQCGNPGVTVASNILVPFLPAATMQPIPFNTCYLPAQGLPVSRSTTSQKLPLPPPPAPDKYPGSLPGHLRCWHNGDPWLFLPPLSSSTFPTLTLSASLGTPPFRSVAASPHFPDWLGHLAAFAL